MYKSIAGWALFAFWGALVPVQAQHCHFALRGLVTEGVSHEILPYATVWVREAGKMAVTDEKGRYEILDLCENTSYTVEVSHVECAHFTQIVRLTENATVDFNLVHDAVLKEVVVLEKAIAPAPAQAQQTVDHADLEAAKGVNLGETLRKLPGVAILATGATVAKPVIQGLHSNRIAIVNNNVVLEGQQWGREHAPEIDPFTAGKITVVKGAGGVRYGPGAMGGAVILEPEPLRKKDGFGGAVVAGAFSNGWGGVFSGQLDGRLPGKRLAFRVQGTAKRSGNLRAPDYFLNNTGAAELNGSFLTAWQAGRWEHEAMASSFNQRLGILRAAHFSNLTLLQQAINSPTPLNNEDVFRYDIERPYQSVRHQTLKYKAVYKIDDVWRLNSQYVFQFNHRREYDVVRSTSAASQKPQLSFRLWSNSLDVALEHLPIRHWQGGIGVQMLQQTNFVGRGGLIPDYDAWGGSIWLMERRRRYPRPWEFEFGVRYDYRQTAAVTSGSLTNLDTLVRFGNFSGTAGVIYHFNAHWSATLNSGLAWRPPHVNELFARGVHQAAGTFEQGNPSMTSEKAWNTNFSLQWRRGNAEALVSVFQNYIVDFIYLDPQNTTVLTVRGAFPAYFYAQADAVLRGVDGSATIPLTDRLSLEARVSLLRAQRLFLTPENGRAWLPLMPADRFQYGLKWTFREVPATPVRPKSESFVRLLANSVLRQTRVPLEGLLKPSPDAFTTLNLEALHMFRYRQKQFEIGLSVQNLLNTRYREYLNFFRFYADEPGINAALRIKMTID